jgi:putative transposase
VENFWQNRPRRDPHEENEVQRKPDRPHLPEGHRDDVKEAEAGMSLEDLSRQHGFSKATYYKWKAQYGGMDVSALKRLKELEEENRRLKQMYAELSLEHKALKDIVEKKL